MRESISRDKVFVARALLIARLEMTVDAAIPAEQAPLPMPPTHLAYYLAYRAGISAKSIALWAGVPRTAIARRLLLTMALMSDDEIWLRVEALAEEMGRARYGDPGCEVIAFPGSWYGGNWWRK
jgi:hypothetical protein